MKPHREWAVCLAILATVSIQAAAGTSVSVHKDLPKKGYPCDIQKFDNDDQASARGRFSKVCSIVADVNTSINGHAEAKAWIEIQRAACGCGADAVIIRNIAGGGPNVSISAEAISFVENSK